MDDSGTIKSPKYPENYPNGMRCVWMIENDNPQSTINLSFEDFKLEETQQCMFDYLLIEEVSSGNEKTIGKFCGRTVPASSISGQKLRISFVADESSNDKGFKLNWQRVGRSINFGGSEKPGKIMEYYFELIVPLFCKLTSTIKSARLNEESK